ncbi:MULTISPECIES: PDR/VanB family oxidoreductase [Micromonospora]|uniref:Ferredoxin n=1 Tax=Micromonospora maris TaxID=1003110 RepID=A0A9X0LFP8_9ACTN|nr:MULTISPECIES: PDR/VanB family oxidoreductase [Micromonospora]AEB43287.1 phthalate 4,5-dioxygenase reductase subunit [Micromonospora maris AB-18-032]KUJ48632.1 ferredoxin [Micromonospora maris]RUL93075.1 oxidoreductase [Verrucosispora sp. FIM060022]
MTEWDLVVTAREQVARDVVALTLGRPDGGDLPQWTPGAHLDLLLGPDLVRQYSLCGDPADRSGLRIAVQREPDGRGGSRQVHDRLTPGATVTVRGPRNNFALVAAARYLFIAGGIGITPIGPMVAAADAAGADWRLVYGGRSRATMAFADALREKYGDRVTLCPQDETGLLDLPGLLGRPEAGMLVYCCGPEALITAVEQHCLGWPPGCLHVERFTPASGVDGVDTTVEVELSISGQTLTVPPGTPILQAVEEAGVQVLSSCREGTCGTCETTVLAGVPDHRDSLLTEEERAAGDTMMICVSRARTPRLVLEL